jgi:hypothetical protein
MRDASTAADLKNMREKELAANRSPLVLLFQSAHSAKLTKSD